MSKQWNKSVKNDVALLAEGVDRNESVRPMWQRCRVALLAEGVDRNPMHLKKAKTALVALLAEGVDRNQRYPTLLSAEQSRPPRGGRG